MAKFKDTPKWKQRQKWDPVAQRLTVPAEPPTTKQVSLLRNLSAERGAPYARPPSKRAAAKAIRELLSRPKAGRS